MITRLVLLTVLLTGCYSQSGSFGPFTLGDDINSVISKHPQAVLVESGPYDKYRIDIGDAFDYQLWVSWDDIVKHIWVGLPDVSKEEYKKYVNTFSQQYGRNPDNSYQADYYSWVCVWETYNIKFELLHNAETRIVTAHWGPP